MLDFLILYEHKNREMESVLLLKYELMKRGYTVGLYNLSFELNDYRSYVLDAKLIITPFFYGNNEWLNYICKKFGSHKKICNLQWEQVYNGKSGENKRTPKEIARKAVHICWGSEAFERLKRNGCNNAVMTGGIHLDFLKPGFSGWYKSREKLFKEFGINPSKKTLIFISSFSYLGLDKDMLKNYNRLTDFDTFEFYELTVKSRDIVLSWFERLLNESEDFNIIYRPHPGELIDDKIKSLCQKYSNLFCISSYSVKQWIKASDTILNWYSTAGTEAFFAGKSNLFLRPIPFDEKMDYEMFSDACKAGSYEDFHDYVLNDKKLNSYYSAHSLEKGISKYYDTRKGYSFIRICDLLEEMLHSNKYDMRNIRPIKRKFPDHLIKKMIKYHLYNRYKANGILVRSASERIEKLNQIMSKYSETEATEIITPKEEKAIFRKLDRIYAKLVR
ncbi:MAG: hypothetical protein IJ555_06690 [Ruminococcus sp.]|nr:hypothetical protein [Ruminococcus sp.]